MIHIQNARDPGSPVTITLEEIIAPEGATIEADDAESVTVTLDGEELALPYRF